MFDLPLNSKDLAPVRDRYDVTEVLRVMVGSGAPTAAFRMPVYRVEPKPGTCP